MANDDEMEDLNRLLMAADMERTVHPESTPAEAAIRVLEDAATVAAMSIVQLSRQSSNEQLRFKAATYILDRVLGDVRGSTGTKPAWEKVLEGITIPDDVREITS